MSRLLTWRPLPYNGDLEIQVFYLWQDLLQQESYAAP